MKHKLILLFFLLLPALGFCQSGSGEVKKVAILEVVDKDGNISSGIKLMLRSKLAEAVGNIPGYETDCQIADKLMKLMKEWDFLSDDDILILDKMDRVDCVLEIEAEYIDESHRYLVVTVQVSEVENVSKTKVAGEAGSIEDLDNIVNKLVEKLFGSR